MKCLLSPEEVALQLYEHLMKGITDKKVFLQHRDPEWAATLVGLMNLVAKAKRDNTK